MLGPVVLSGWLWNLCPLLPNPVSPWQRKTLQGPGMSALVQLRETALRSLLETPPSSLSSFNRLHRRSCNILRSCTCHTEAKDGPGEVQVSGVRPWPILENDQSIHLLVSISFCLAFLLSYDISYVISSHQQEESILNLLPYVEGISLLNSGRAP